MPVMVTGVDNVVGDNAVRLLRSQDGEVRVFLQDVTGDDPSEVRSQAGDRADVLRAAGCKVARGDLTDEGHIETALEQVHTVLHLLGRPTDDPDTYLEQTATVISAAIGAGCRRIVLLSDLCVASPDGNEWLLALQEAEEMIAVAPMESVALRCAVIIGRGDPLTMAMAGGGTVDGTGGGMGQDPPGRHWPVAAVDVATAAVLADSERDLDSSLHVVVHLAGPKDVSTAGLVGLLQEAGVVAGTRLGASRLPGHTLPGHTLPGHALPGHAVELLGRNVPRPKDALGLRGTSVAGALASGS